MDKSTTRREQCPGCDRHPSICWLMSCLLLEQYKADGYRGCVAWARASGIKMAVTEAEYNRIQAP